QRQFRGIPPFSLPPQVSRLEGSPRPRTTEPAMTLTTTPVRTAAAPSVPVRPPAPAGPPAVARLPEASGRSGPQRPRRDGFVDAIRAVGLVAVVALHWLMAEATWDGSTLRVGN